MRLVQSLVFTCVMGLVALGLVMLVSASAAQPQAKYYGQQVIWAGVGLVAMAIAYGLDYRRLARPAVVPWVIWAVTLAALLAVLLLGAPRNGARRWLSVAGLSVQPSEFAKIGLVVVLAWWGARWQKQLQKWWQNFWFGMVLPGLVCAPVLGLILIEPDIGTTALLVVLAALVLFLAGTRWVCLVVGAVAAGVALGIVIQAYPERLERIRVFLEGPKHLRTLGYQTEQAKVALGSGGPTGLGLGNGRQKLGFVPEHHTDFILSVIGEELGLVATLSVLAAYAAIIVCGLYIAWHAADLFGLLLAAGLTSLIGLQALLNIAVVTECVPNKGLPLPFVSYGGSNLVAMMICVGLLLNVARRAGADPRSLVQNPFALAGQPM